jgi:hypothetical protein
MDDERTASQWIFPDWRTSTVRYRCRGLAAICRVSDSQEGSRRFIDFTGARETMLSLASQNRLTRPRTKECSLLL